MSFLTEPQKEKDTLRRLAESHRQAQPDKDQASRVICQKFTSLPEYYAAGTVMFYVDRRDEVRTQQLLPEAVGQRTVVVPYCVGDGLELFRLERMNELCIGTYGILEPRLDLRAMPGKRVDFRQVDLVLVPGVAFDRHGGRLGHGRGYYDRLLVHARPGTVLVGAAFECQVLPEVPMSETDIFLDLVLTEQATYAGRRRTG